jgi:hypothetical protein
MQTDPSLCHTVFDEGLSCCAVFRKCLIDNMIFGKMHLALKVHFDFLHTLCQTLFSFREEFSGILSQNY